MMASVNTPQARIIELIAAQIGEGAQEMGCKSKKYNLMTRAAAT